MFKPMRKGYSIGEGKKVRGDQIIEVQNIAQNKQSLSNS